MRMRIHYALASDNVSPLGGVMNRGMAQVPDVARFGRSQMEQLAMLQAQAYKKQLENPGSESQRILSDIGTSLRESSTDANYLETFFVHVPMGSVGKLGYSLHKQHKDGTVLNNVDKKILGDFGSTLAVLSKRKDQASTDAVWNALGEAGADMPSQAMLVKFSAPDVKWGSQVLADLGKASLRWRQAHPSYEIDESSGTLAGETHSKLLNQPHREWWKDWGIDGDDLKKMREYDPALGVLGRIKDQNDTAAARALAGANLEESLLIKDPEKAPALSFLTRSNGGTYASLLVAPDWLDKGSAAGSVIRLATTPDKGHEDESARIAADLIKSVAWWNDTGRPKVDKLLRNTGAPDWIPHSKQYKAEYGDGLRDGLLQMTQMHIPALVANRTSGGSPDPITDLITGQRYADLDGDEVQHFLGTFASDDRRWGLVSIAAERYRRQLYALGLRSSWKLKDVNIKIGRLYGNLIYAYTRERITREKITDADVKRAGEQLATVRDVAKLFLEGTPAGENPAVGLVYDKSTTWLLSNVKYKDFEKKVQQIQVKDENYSDQLFVDLAYGYKMNGSKAGGGIDALLQKNVLTADDRARLVGWAKTHVFFPGSEHPHNFEETGDTLVSDTEDKVDHQAPPQVSN
jgi:hypothetical protein